MHGLKSKKEEQSNILVVKASEATSKLQNYNKMTEFHLPPRLGWQPERCILQLSLAHRRCPSLGSPNNQPDLALYFICKHPILKETHTENTFLLLSRYTRSSHKAQ